MCADQRHDLFISNTSVAGYLTGPTAPVFSGYLMVRAAVVGVVVVVGVVLVVLVVVVVVVVVVVLVVLFSFMALILILMTTRHLST